MAIGAAVCALHFASFGVRSLGIFSDTRVYLYFAWRIREGAVPHVEYFDNKTQLASFLGALLFRLGEALGVEPLFAIRAGYLALAGAAGLVVFAVHRALFGGRTLQGVLGLLAYCGFPFIGLYASTGPVPKLFVFAAAGTAALLVHRRRWTAAGAVAALAFMDWQVGALVWLACLVTALALERPRAPAALRLVAGGAAGIVPFVAYYALNGALRAAFQQTIGASFSRASESLQTTGPGERLARIARLAEAYVPAGPWLFALAAAGGVVALVLCVRWRERDEARLLLPLVVTHLGVTAFSWVDFQGYGDFLLLLASLSFFVGLAWNAAWEGLRQRLRHAGPRVAAGAAIAVLATASAGPGPLRPEMVLHRYDLDAESPEELEDFRPPSLADQRAVLADLRRTVGDAPFCAPNKAELHFLAREPTPLPVAYWNQATWSHYREGDERSIRTFERLIEAAHPDVLVWNRRRSRLLAGYARTVDLSSADGLYRAVVHMR